MLCSMGWILAALLVLAVLGMLGWWLSRPLPPATLSEVDLESEFYGLQEYAIGEASVVLTHLRTKRWIEFQRTGDAGLALELRVGPGSSSAEARALLERAGFVGELCDNGESVALGALHGRECEEWAALARQLIRVWPLDPAELYACRFRGQKDNQRMKQRLRESVERAKSA